MRRTHYTARLSVFSLLLFVCNLSHALTSGDTVEGSIVAPGQAVSYSFSVNEGEGYLLQVARTGGNSDFAPRFYLTSPSGADITTSIYGDSAASRTAGLSGTYTLSVVDFGAGEDTGSYRLSFVKANGATDQGTVNSGQEYSGSIELGGLDSYKFYAGEGEGFVLQIAETGEDTGFAPRLRLYDPSGQNITTSIYGDPSKTWTASAAGYFTLVVADFGLDDNTGNYTFSFVKAGGNTNQGQMISGQTYTGSISLGGLDSYTVFANTGEGFVIQIAESGEDTDFAPRVRTYDPNGTNITTSIYGDSSKTWTAGISGYYTVVVSDFGLNDEIGNYRMSFVRAKGDTDQGVIANGQVLGGSIELGGLDSFNFFANEGEGYTLQVGKLGGDSDFAPRYKLYAPSGQNITQSIYGDSSSTRTASLSGMYTVVVHDFGLNDNTGSYLLNHTLTSSIFSYAALGDSYSSGEGVAPYENPADTLYSGCHRSTRAYPQLIKLPGDPTELSDRSDVEFSFLACSGAETKHVQAAGEPRYDLPPQLAPSNHVDASRDLVTITIGGNDAQFANIIKFCLAHPNCTTIEPFAPHSDMQLAELFPLLAARAGYLQLLTLSELKSKTPNAATLVMDYPILLGGNECPAASVPLLPDLKLSAEEQSDLRDANALFNTITRQVANIVGLHVVSVEDHFEGHGVCGTNDDWIAGLRVPDFKSSFHPTARGQREYAKIINNYLQSTSSGWPHGYHDSGMPRNPPPGSGSFELPEDAPEVFPTFGDLQVSMATPISGCEDKDILVIGETVSILGQGFAPNESVTLRMVFGSTQIPLGTHTVDAEGQLNTAAVVPAGTPIDAQGTIEALGAGANGAGLLLIATAVVGENVDADGDGFIDACDNCPDAFNPTQADADGDGRGDSCDACANDPLNDEDGDGLCADADVCPFDADNDIDGDGLCADVDNCPLVSNAGQVDTDSDLVGDTCDNCPLLANPDQSDFDNDGVGNVCDVVGC